MDLTEGDIYAEFKLMRIPHSRLDPVASVMNNLRRCKRRTPRSPQSCASLFARTQSGKSTAVAHYIETVVVDELVSNGAVPSANLDRLVVAESQRIVLHVTLSQNATPKTLASDILWKLGDPRAYFGTGDNLLARAYHLMAECGTELLVVDEVQHLSAISRRDSDRNAEGMRTSKSVTNTLKVMLIRGLVPILFVGIESARHHLFNDDQLAPRCVKEIDYSPLRPYNDKEVELFAFYLGSLGLKLKICGIMKKKSNFLFLDIMPCVMEVAGGRLGMASNLVCAASVIAHERGDEEVVREHLADATDQWAIRQGIIDYNPFRAGVRQAELA